MKITRTQLEQLIKEEISRINRIKELEEKKQQLSEAVQKLEEGQDIDELFGGISHLFKKAGQGIASGAKSLGNSALQGAKALGKDAADSASQAYQDVKGVGQNIVQTYKQGEEIQAKKQAQAKIANVHSQIKQLLNQYQQLTGKPFNSKAVAGPAAFRKAAPAPAPVNPATDTASAA